MNEEAEAILEMFKTEAEEEWPKLRKELKDEGNEKLEQIMKLIAIYSEKIDREQDPAIVGECKDILDHTMSALSSYEARLGIKRYNAILNSVGSVLGKVLSKVAMEFIDGMINGAKEKYK
jgi:hypothetical protein